MKLPNKKPIRLKNYDYSEPGAYFITICTKGRKPILSRITVGTGILDRPQNILSSHGEIANNQIKYMNGFYPEISVDKYVIMPNHIHLLLTIERPIESLGNKTIKNPDVQTVVRSFKRMTVNEAGCSFWQESFYESIIDTDESYSNVCDYIEKNPMNWIADKYYRE